MRTSQAAHTFSMPLAATPMLLPALMFLLPDLHA
jgi:hypothetical protein